MKPSAFFSILLAGCGLLGICHKPSVTFRDAAVAVPSPVSPGQASGETSAVTPTIAPPLIHAITTGVAEHAPVAPVVSFDQTSSGPSGSDGVPSDRLAQLRLTAPPALPTTVAVAATNTGRWVNVPIYGRFGRFQGYQKQWQPAQRYQPVRYTQPVRYYGGGCSNGRCGR